MSNAFSLYRALVIYAICVPLALFLGYMVASPENLGNLTVVGAVLGLLTIPFILRWHQPLLVFSWNMIAVMFFLPGKPMIFLPMCVLSFMVSALQYTLNRKLKFLSVPSLTWPLLALAALVLITARLTGGIGLKISRDASFGGWRYLIMLVSILGYFAVAARRIPVERARFYMCLYLLSALSGLIGYLVSVATPSLYIIFNMFPPDSVAIESISTQVVGFEGIQRLGSLSGAGSTCFVVLLAMYGIRGVFDLRKPWRLLALLASAVITMSGGFRSALIMLMLVFAIQFWLEGLFRSRLLPALVLCVVLGAALVVPLADKLPLSIQRTLSFLPLQIDARAEMDAQGSTDWRLTMWQRLLPDVPKYLLLGKGYSVNPQEMEMLNSPSMRLGVDHFDAAIMAGDYHSGPFSVIMTFGIWGVLIFFWFLHAGIKVLYRNYLFGDPRLKKINTFLLAYFVAKSFFFFTVFGSLYSDMATFTGMLGLSVAMNGGVRSAAPAKAVKQTFKRLRLAAVAAR